MRTVTLDEFNNYMYCGEYYRNYLSNNVNLIETLDYGDQFVYALIKTIFFYKLENQVFPSENEIINFILVGLQYYEKYNLPGFFQDQITNLIRLVGSIMDAFKSYELLEAFQTYEYTSSDMKLIYDSHFCVFEKGKHRVLFIVGNQKPRQYLKSIEYGLDLIMLEQNYDLSTFKPTMKFISTKTKGDLILEFKSLDYNIESAKYFLDTMLKSMSLEIYKPIWRCQNINCPVYSECSVGNRIPTLD